MESRCMSYSVRYTSEAETDLLKLAKFEYNVTGDTSGTDHLRLMLKNLGNNPKVGAVYEQSNDIRQIHVLYGKSGYSALYKVFDVVEIVGILRVKHQKENNY